MADMYGVVLSRTFRVRDESAFRAWFEKYKFGDDITVYSMEGTDEDSGGEGRPVKFGGHEQYPSAWPKVPGDPDYDIDEVEADLGAWAGELREHLVDGEILHVLAFGATKMISAEMQELAVDARGEAFRYSHTGDRALAERLITPAQEG